MRAPATAWADPTTPGSNPIVGFDPDRPLSDRSKTDAPSVSGATLSLPNFGAYNPVYAFTARIAGRINASSIPQKEVDDLLRERQNLLDKYLAGTITKSEKNRLEYVRWSLDRVEDAKYGQILDRLDAYTKKYQQFRRDLQSLGQQLRNATHRSR